jgi:hypothetical protein
MDSGGGDTQIAKLEEFERAIDSKLPPRMAHTWYLGVSGDGDSSDGEPARMRRLIIGRSEWRCHRFAFSALRETLREHADFAARAIATTVYNGPNVHCAIITMKLGPDAVSQEPMVEVHFFTRRKRTGGRVRD